MADFKVITTQEELDAVIGERLARERSTVEKRFDGWTSPEKLSELKQEYEKQLENLKASHTTELESLGTKHAEELQTLQNTVSEKEKLVQEGARYKTDLEKTRIALAAGLPERYAVRLVGATPDEWKADAAEMAKDFTGGRTQPASPLGGTDTAPSGDYSSIEAAAYSSMLSGLKGD